jgi:putative ABC transport system permease protein
MIAITSSGASETDSARNLTFASWALVRALSEEGIRELTVPVGQLFTYVVTAGLPGALSRRWPPARRAARLDVLRAIATD